MSLKDRFQASVAGEAAKIAAEQRAKEAAVQAAKEEKKQRRAALLRVPGVRPKLAVLEAICEWRNQQRDRERGGFSVRGEAYELHLQTETAAGSTFAWLFVPRVAPGDVYKPESRGTYNSHSIKALTMLSREFSVEQIVDEFAKFVVRKDFPAPDIDFDAVIRPQRGGLVLLSDDED